MCICCISAVEVKLNGVFITNLDNFAAFESILGPVNSALRIPRELDFFKSSIIFLLEPLVVIAIRKSFLLPIASSSLEKI